MWRIALVALLLTGCVTRPVTPEEIEAKQFRAVPDKAVIYLVREPMDFSREAAAVSFDWVSTGSTYAGTFIRWVADPGERRIAGFGADTGEIRLKVEPGRIYFVNHSVIASRRARMSFFRLLDEKSGRDAVNRAELISLF